MSVQRRSYVPMAAIGVAAFGAFLAFLDSTVVNVAFPDIQSSFPHATISTLSWVFNAYNVVFAGFLVLSGRFADLLGRRRMFKIGIVVFTLASALCAASDSVGMLIGLRAVQALGAAMLVPASLGIVVHASSADHRTHALSIWAAAAALAAGLGPPIGGALVDLYNWRLVFLINIPLGLAAWVLTRSAVIESRAPGSRLMPDLRGALLLSAALGSATLAIVQGGPWGWGSAGTVSAFVVSAVCMVLCVFSSAHHRSPILDPQLLRIRGFLVSNIVAIACGLGLYCYLLAHILWLHYVWGYSLFLAGLAVAPGAVVAAITSLPAGRLAEKLGPRPVVFGGALVWTLAYVWYSTRVGLKPDFVGQWLPGQILSGIGVGCTLPTATAGGLATVPAGRYATASAFNTSARQLGGVLGIALLTVFISHATLLSFADDVRKGWRLAAVSFAVAGVASLFFGRVRETSELDDMASRGPLVDPDPVPEPASALTTNALASGPDFLDLLTPDARERLLSAGEETEIPAGTTLFRAGEPGDTLFVLKAGRLELEVAGGAKMDFYPVSTLGELALLTDGPRNGKVVARRDSRLVRVGRERFAELAAAEPAVMNAVAKGIAFRLQDSRPNRPMTPPEPKVVSVVGVHEDDQAQSIAAEVERALAERGLRVVCLQEVTPDGLQRAEGENDRVVLVGALDASLRRSCIRQGDRVVLVCRDPEPVGVPSVHVPCDVVLTGTRPTQSQIVAWHDQSGCRRVYWSARTPAGLPERLRPLAARAWRTSRSGLVLAGGGARSLAHLGVLQVLEQSGIVIDRVAGTSMGAFIASLYATGATASEVDAVVFDEFVRRNPFGDYRPSLTSLARGERGKRWCGDASERSVSRSWNASSWW